MILDHPESGEADGQALLGNWLTWAALRHFLPTTTLRALCSVVVQKVGETGLSLSDLFEEEILVGRRMSYIDSWVLRPRAVETTNHNLTYLQSRIRHWLINSDSEAFTEEQQVRQGAAISAAQALEAACELGNFDFTSLVGGKPTRGELGDEAVRELEALLLNGGLETPDVARKDFESRFTNVSRPLNAVLAKHVGDLYADLDDWECARTFYSMVVEMLERGASKTLRNVEEVLRDLTQQSLAAAEWVCIGPRAAESRLARINEADSLVKQPILSLNGGSDYMYAQVCSSERLHFPTESRGALMGPPQLASSHDLGAALSYAAEKQFVSASKMFWSVLRRQQSLGLTLETRSTKFSYGQAILAELEVTSATQQDPYRFALAVRLLIESAEVTAIEKMVWSKELVQRFVTEEAVRSTKTRADRYAGVRIERQRATMELYRHWIEHVDESAGAALQEMLNTILEHAKSSPVLFIGNRDLGSRAFQILEAIGKKRQEIAPMVAGKFTGAFVARMQVGAVWNIKRDALSAALVFVDGLDTGNLESVISHTLLYLDQIDPAANLWHMVQPALQLLVTNPSAAMARENTRMGGSILDAILRFGIEQETENATLLHYLSAFDSKLLSDPKIVAAARPALEKVRIALRQENSSATAHNIQSLFLAPSISGRDLISDGIATLRRVIESVPGRNANISFQVACYPVLQLIQVRESLGQVPGCTAKQVDKWFLDLFEAIESMWRRAKTNPMIFAAFSIPAQAAPNPTAVHNWAFVSMRLADAIGKVEEMRSALVDAATEPLLRKNIEVGIAVSEVSADRAEFRPAESELREVFYASLGRRLLGIRSLEPAKARGLYLELLSGCFRHGPNAMDAAVMVAALDRNLGEIRRDAAVKNYLTRLEANTELRLLVTPLVTAVVSGGGELH